MTHTSNKPIGDGVTDDTEAVQAILDKDAPKTSRFQDFPWKEFDTDNKETWPEDGGDYLLNHNGALEIGHWRNNEFFGKNQATITHYISDLELLCNLMGYKEIGMEHEDVQERDK